MKSVTLLLSVIIALPLHGQPRTSIEPTPSTSPLAFAAAAKTSEGGTFAVRAGAGVLGWFAGAAAGAFVASVLPHHDCHCDDPGLDEAVIGIALGGTIGAAAGAAFPSLGRGCGYGTRFGRAVLGSLAGTLVGLLAAIPTNEPLVLIVFPVASASGSALAIGRC